MGAFLLGAHRVKLQKTNIQSMEWIHRMGRVRNSNIIMISALTVRMLKDVRRGEVHKLFLSLFL